MVGLGVGDPRHPARGDRVGEVGGQPGDRDAVGQHDEGAEAFGDDRGRQGAATVQRSGSRAANPATHRSTNSTPMARCWRREHGGGEVVAGVGGLAGQRNNRGRRDGGR